MKQAYIAKKKRNHPDWTDSKLEQSWKDYLSSNKKNKQNVGQGKALIKKPKSAVRAPRANDPLAPCSKNYAIASVDPWGVPEPPCVPDDVNIPSFKFASRIRTTLTTGGTAAFVHYSPYTAVCNSATCFWSSNSSFVGVNVAVQGATGVTAGYSDSPYTYDYFEVQADGSTRLARIVGGGIRIRYIGPEQYRGGRYILYRNPGNVPIVSGMTPYNLATDRNATTAVVDREWHSVVWKPVYAAELAYPSIAGVAAGQNPVRNDNAGPLLIFVDGCNTNSSFEVDVITWYEIVGPLQPFVTPSHSDIVGFSAVQAARGEINQSGSMSDTVTNFMESVYSGLSAMSGIISPAAPVMMNFAKDLAKKALTTSGNGLGQTLALGYW